MFVRTVVLVPFVDATPVSYAFKERTELSPTIVEMSGIFT